MRKQSVFIKYWISKCWGCTFCLCHERSHLNKTKKTDLHKYPYHLVNYLNSHNFCSIAVESLHQQNDVQKKVYYLQPFSGLHYINLNILNKKGHLTTCKHCAKTMLNQLFLKNITL